MVSTMCNQMFSSKKVKAHPLLTQYGNVRVFPPVDRPTGQYGNVPEDRQRVGRHPFRHTITVPPDTYHLSDPLTRKTISTT